MEREKVSEQKYHIISEIVRQNAANAVMMAPDNYEVLIRPKRTSRSNSQNRLFHMWMREVSQGYAESTGEWYAPEVWKEYFKKLHLGQETIRGIDITRATSKMTVSEMQDFLTWIDHYSGSELGIVLSHPLDLYTESFK